MFGNLRQGNKILILHKSAPTLSIDSGIVETTSNIPMMGYYQQFGMPVDLSVRIGEKVVTYQRLPANMETAEVIEGVTGEQVIVACNKDSLVPIVQDLKQKSIDHLNAKAFHEQRIASCDSIYNQLNPEIAIKAAQDAEMRAMREEMERMRKQIETLKADSRTSQFQKPNQNEYNDSKSPKEPGR